MSSIVRQRVGNKIYLYESISYRNPEGKPRNKRVPIGKIDPSTNQPIYKPDYLDRMAEPGKPIAADLPIQAFTRDDIRRSSVFEFGTQYLLENVAKQIGLLTALQNTMPKIYQEIFTLSCYLVSSGDPFLYCQEWLSKTSSSGGAGSLSSQRISDLLQAITLEEREAFYQAWCKLRCEQEYLALDITSTSSYSELIHDVEWGYNRDKETLPQINICMLMGETSRLPIYQVIYSGSLKDVSTLETTLAKMDAISGGKPMLTVLDKGFFSTRNVDAMLDHASSRFIIAIPFSSTFARKMVSSEQKDIDQLENTIVIGEDSLRAVTKQRVWNKNHRLYTHVYYNPMKALKLREELYAYVTILKERAETDPKTAQMEELSKKYLIIRKSENTPTGYTVSIREEVVAKQLETAGWLIVLSNDIADAKKALVIYRQKDVVEKGFLRLKTQLDLGRLRVHRDDSMQNKIFICFIALIIMSHLHTVMLDKDLYKKMTMKKLLLILSKLRVQHINGQRILFPLTKEQKTIYKAFSVNEPM